MPTEIPADIWIEIASFLPDELLRNMLNLNRLFFRLAMGVRYRHISISTQNASLSRKLLNRFDPAIAQYTRSMNIRMAPVSGYLALHPDDSSEVHDHRKRSIYCHPTVATQSNNHRLDRYPTVNEMIVALIEVIPGLTGVNDIIIDATDLAELCNLKHLFSMAWSTFGSNLLRVVLAGSLEFHRLAMVSRPKFGCLTDLALDITNTYQLHDQRILVCQIAPFVNMFAGQLQSFRLWSWDSPDLGPFFVHMEPLPILKALDVKAGFNKAFPSDVSGLTRLLHRTAGNLKELTLLLNPLDSFIDRSAEIPVSIWIGELLLNENMFTNLRALEIFPTTLSNGLDITIEIIKRSEGTLEELRIRDRTLDLVEIRTLLDVLTNHSNLQHLSIDACEIDVTTIDLLASRLPSLFSVSLSYPSSFMWQPNVLLAFRNEMKSRKYCDWKLNNFGIWCTGRKVDLLTMDVVAMGIPSLQTLWGERHV
ncbi:hypothetical protein BDQ17DRAFT_1249705 [Cyathus striatus]|nr:hypothetical protein BDQ17DRAFT_1249705 [Cyathus striatus]